MDAAILRHSPNVKSKIKKTATIYKRSKHGALLALYFPKCTCVRLGTCTAGMQGMIIAALSRWPIGSKTNFETSVTGRHERGRVTRAYVRRKENWKTKQPYILQSDRLFHALNIRLFVFFSFLLTPFANHFFFFIINMFLQ